VDGDDLFRSSVLSGFERTEEGTSCDDVERLPPPSGDVCDDWSNCAGHDQSSMTLAPGCSSVKHGDNLAIKQECSTDAANCSQIPYISDVFVMKATRESRIISELPFVVHKKVIINSLKIT